MTSGIAKLAINVIASVGASKVTTDYIGTKIKTAVGGLVIGSVITEVAVGVAYAGINQINKLRNNEIVIEAPVDETGDLETTA